MSEEQTQVAPVQSPADELESLKAKANLMGISYHPSIGNEALRAKISAKLNDQPDPTEATKDTEATAEEPEFQHVEESASERRGRKRREAMELVRVRVQCMNPSKSEWEGEIFSAGNTTVGTFTKYVPFNADEGWHIPRIIFNVMKERKCQIFESKKDSRGNTTRQGKLIREFAIEVLEPLTTEELAELARRQAAQRSID